MISHHLHPGDWRGLLPMVDRVDALIVDAPYSADVHEGHDAAPTVHRSHRSGTGGLSWESWGGGNPSPREYQRRAIDYDGWTPDDVREFVAAWSPRTDGWMVSITDHNLAPVWSAAMEACGRYTFAPISWLAPGSRVRLAGDGPSSWACWIVVGRPRSGEHRNGTPWTKWGTLPGGYVTTGRVGIDGDGSGAVVGAKPLSLMHDLIRDYTMPGDVVCDPCAGGGTTLCAALDRGRFAIGAEVDPDTHAQALARIERHRVRAERMTTHELRRHDRPDRVEQLAQRAAARGATVAEQAALPLGG